MREIDLFDVLIIGSGASGLSLAIRLAEQAPRTRIAVVSKFALSEGSTFYAQGGISAVLDTQDSLASHIDDTLQAGAGLCDPAIVSLTVDQGKDCIDWLLAHGLPFTKEAAGDGSSRLHLNREGGHTHRRIAHAADATGQALFHSLEKSATAYPSIHFFEYHSVVDLITTQNPDGRTKRIAGAYIYDAGKKKVEVFRARMIVLATGGASKVYLYTSNPDVSTGDGIALAWRAGCRIANMEFMQFHPTCLYHPDARSFLIS